MDFSADINLEGQAFLSNLEVQSWAERENQQFQDMIQN